MKKTILHLGTILLLITQSQAFEAGAYNCKIPLGGAGTLDRTYNLKNNGKFNVIANLKDGSSKTIGEGNWTSNNNTFILSFDNSAGQEIIEKEDNQYTIGNGNFKCSKLTLNDIQKVHNEKSLTQDHAIAQCLIADKYIQERNYNKAFSIYKKYADQGYAKAQNNLASMYAEGKGVRKDVAKAVFLYGLAKKQGNEKAKINIGRVQCIDSNVYKHLPICDYWKKEMIKIGHDTSKSWNKFEFN